MIKFKPILFSTPMVQAILEGRKTMTRRIIKSNHESGLFAVGRRKSDGQITKITSLDWDECSGDVTNDIQCRYGKVGDVLWVRETWNCISYLNPDNTEYKYFYKADNGNDFSKWKPSIFMPKATCRIFLEITNVKVERLQEISDEDAKSEGVEFIPNMAYPQNWKDYSDEFAPPLISPQHSFISLWDSINGEESWEANPFVWVIEFKQIEKPENFIINESIIQLN
jgi:hypothetical protein